MNTFYLQKQKIIENVNPVFVVYLSSCHVELPNLTSASVSSLFNKQSITILF